MARSKAFLGAAMSALALFSAMTAAAYGVAPLNEKKETTTFTFAGSSEKTTALSVLGSSLELKCGKTTMEGNVEGLKFELGRLHLGFEKCTTSLGGTCTGLGDASGTILALGPFHLVSGSPSPALELFLFEHLHYTCIVLGVSKLFLVLGELLCPITPVGVLTSTFTITCKRGAERGDPETTSYNGGTLTNALQSAEGDTTETMAAEAGEIAFTVTPQVQLD